MITLADIESARTRIAGSVRCTPTLELSQLKSRVPGTGGDDPMRVTLKLELLQVTGSFKARGAMNRFLATPAAELEKGIVTASGGNHGIAVARTASVGRVPATVFVPKTVSPEKAAKIEAWGAAIRIVGNEWMETSAAALGFADASQAVYLHPFADPLVVAGQGTLGLEILEDIPDMDAILIAVGGGGLAAGMSAAIRAKRPNVKIIGVEPVGSPTLKACLDAGRLVALDAVTSKVATLSCRQTDARVFDLVRQNVDEILLVTDEAMLDAARWLWFEMGIAADLSGAAALAALRQGVPALAGSKHVCVLVCGAGPEGVDPSAA